MGVRTDYPNTRRPTGYSGHPALTPRVVTFVVMPSLPGRPAPILLELDLTSPLIEFEPDDPVSRLRTRGRPRLGPVLRALHEAHADDRVRGLIVKVGGAALSWATMQELRDGVRAFAAAGKPTVAWAETLGDGGNGTVDYVLASAFGEVWLQASGELCLLGVAAETTFLRGALDRLGVEPQLDQRYEYKNAADRVMRTEFTPEHREAADRLAESVWTVAVDAIAADRGLTAPEVRRLAETAPLTAPDAVAAGLVDRIGYRDEVYAELRSRLAGEVQLLYADRWAPKRHLTQVVRRHLPSVALVDGSGQIAAGRSRRGPVGARLGSDSVSAALRAAREDDDVRAVVFRIDSPGGSAVASDTIWREVCLTRDTGKPVIVSMGNLAGSGGYYIACPADLIVAEPATLTGSIGVLGGKAVITGLLDRVGLTTGAVAQGGRARMFSARQGFTDGERERLGRLLDAVYDDFVAKVAAGRGMTREAVHEVARGRVWTGADAATNGLVDVLGGIRDATRIARERAGLKAGAPLRPAVHVGALGRLRRPRSSDDPRAASLALTGWGDLGTLAAAVGLPPAGPLTMESVRLR